MGCWQGSCTGLTGYTVEYARASGTAHAETCLYARGEGQGEGWSRRVDVVGRFRASSAFFVAHNSLFTL